MQHIRGFGEDSLWYVLHYVALDIVDNGIHMVLACLLGACIHCESSEEGNAINVW